MDQDETIKLLQEENYRLKCENRLLKERIKEIDQLKGYIKELEARLSLYENAHTPPSLRRDQNRKKGRNKGGNGTPGQKFGHKGITRPQAEPDRQVEVTVDRCPGCGTKLGEPFRTDTKIIEEIPEPQPNSSPNIGLRITGAHAAIEKWLETIQLAPMKAYLESILLLRRYYLNMKTGCPTGKFETH